MKRKKDIVVVGMAAEWGGDLGAVFWIAPKTLGGRIKSNMTVVTHVSTKYPSAVYIFVFFVGIAKEPGCDQVDQLRAPKMSIPDLLSKQTPAHDGPGMDHLVTMHNWNQRESRWLSLAGMAVPIQA